MLGQKVLQCPSHGGGETWLREGLLDQFHDGLEDELRAWAIICISRMTLSGADKVLGK